MQQNQDQLQQYAFSELNQKFQGVEFLHTIFSLLFPGLYVPKLSKANTLLLHKSVTIINLYENNGEVNALFSKQFGIFKEYMLKLTKFNHFVTNPIMKVYLDKKIELR